MADNTAWNVLNLAHTTQSLGDLTLCQQLEESDVSLRLCMPL